MRKNKYMEMSPEGLVDAYYHTVAKEVNYPRNKSYPVERLKIEKELIRRLGGDWLEFCKISGYVMEE